MISWRTTLSGISAAIGAALTASYMFGGVPQWVGATGAALTAAALALMGMSARDNMVTSEEAGAKSQKK